MIGGTALVPQLINLLKSAGREGVAKSSQLLSVMNFQASTCKNAEGRDSDEFLTVLSARIMPYANSESFRL